MSTAIEIRNLSFCFEDGSAALRDVSLQISKGECVGLVGPNGAGKSTLLLHLAGILPEPGSGGGQGEIILLGEPVDAQTRDLAHRRVGLLFQDPDDQLFCPTVGEDVAFGPRQLGLRGALLRERVAASLARVGLAGFERRLPHRLSGGEKKRVALAGLLAYGPEILVFDEPTSGLDPRARRQLIDVLQGLSATRLLATHDLALVVELCSRTIVLDRGSVVAHGPTQSILRQDELMQAHGLETPRLDLPERLLRSV